MSDKIEQHENQIKNTAHNPVTDALDGARKKIEDFLHEHHLDIAHEVNKASSENSRRDAKQAEKFLPSLTIAG